MSLKKHIPNTITALNLACGVLGVVFALDGRVDLAFALMLAAALFDFCDGLAARVLDAYSEMGKQLDSLADMVSFGVLPAVMMHRTMSLCTWYHGWLCYIPLAFAVFAGLRLAHFNVDERQHSSFIGLASPVAALLCASLCCFTAFEPLSALAQWCGTLWFIPTLALASGVLMVSGVPMFSLKFGKGMEADSKLKFKRISFLAEAFAMAVLAIVLSGSVSLAIALVCALYIVKNLVYAIFRI